MPQWKNISEEKLSTLGKDLLSCLLTPAVVFVNGKVGAGKTTLIYHLVSFIDGDSKNSKSFSSPTYSLINTYNRVFHADFYRLESPEELEYLELPLYVEEYDYFFVEWGKEYSKILQREFGKDFHYYNLTIVQETLDGSARSYFLSDVK